MSDPFVAEMGLFPFNFPPHGWALAAGQLMPISQNTALFSLLGTFYGGDGRATFGLPNLQGSCAIGQGQGPGLSSYFIGESGGQENVSLIVTEIPVHTHTVHSEGFAQAGSTDPTNNGLARPKTSPGNFTTPTLGNPQQLAPNAVSVSGSSLPHNNMMPYLTMNWCIALQGVFPARG